MTPKEKSIQLIRKYSDINVTVCNFDLKRFGNEVFYHTDRLITKSAKECALIAVDEIISICPHQTYKETLHPYDGAELSINYWLEVKQEIEKF